MASRKIQKWKMTIYVNDLANANKQKHWELGRITVVIRVATL